MSKEDQELNQSVAEESSQEETKAPQNAKKEQKPSENKQESAVDVSSLEKKFQEELNRKISEEKNKLYKTMETLEKEKSEFADKLKAYEEKEAEAARLAEEERQAKLSAEERTKEMQDKLKQELETISNAFSSLKEETEQKLRQKDLELYKRDLMSGHSDYIPELISGETAEEIRASFEKSRERYYELIGKVKSDLEKERKPSIPNMQALNDTSPVASETKGEETSFNSKDIVGMSKDEFENHKNSILSKYGV